jgi:hypothetical protein
VPRALESLRAYLHGRAYLIRFAFTFFKQCWKPGKSVQVNDIYDCETRVLWPGSGGGLSKDQIGRCDKHFHG